jgi:hypothetical protein
MKWGWVRVVARGGAPQLKPGASAEHGPVAASRSRGRSGVGLRARRMKADVFLLYFFCFVYARKCCGSIVSPSTPGTRV